jgi:glucose/arabinose dehydrogenase
MNSLTQIFKSKKNLLTLVVVIGAVGAISATLNLAQTPKSRTVLASNLLQGFQDEKVVAGFTNPTAMQFAPDGRLFVSEKAGKLRIIKNGALLTTPFLTVNVNTNAERGLQGVAFDPNFATNRYVYIYYTNEATLKNRLSRFRADITNPDIAEAGSETVLVDNIASDAAIHNGGAIHFGKDGKLYFSTGDGGTNSSNAQNLGNLNGKIMRLNADGSIPADNPYVGQTGKRAEIWANGFRNPFTFAVDSVNGTIYVNDVGGGAVEEVNELQKGANYGWPTCEGSCTTAGFTNPITQYDHSVGSAITGGAFYHGTQYPPENEGDYFFADYTRGWIKRFDIQTKVVTDFITGAPSPVDLKLGPDGNLYYLSLSEDMVGQGAVFKITYGAPIAVPTANPSSGEVPLTVAFDGSGSSDPSGDTNLTYSWDFGDGSPAQTGTNVSHTYNTAGIYQAVLSVTNSSQKTGTSPVTITAGNIQTITFDNAPGQDAPLNGQYPTGVVNWGTNEWYLSGPWGAFTTKSMSFNGAGNTSGVFTFISPKKLVSLDAYNGGTSNSTVTLSCAGNPNKVVSVPFGVITKISTGWTAQCTTVTLASTNGWDTNFDNIVYDSGSTTNNQLPAGTITTPATGALYNAGDTVSYSGEGTDPEDGSLAANAFSWTIVYHHDTHTHPFLGPITGSKTGTFTIPTNGEPSSNVFYRVRLTVTDSVGGQHVSYVDVTPRKADITLQTVPAGLQVTLDGQPRTAPYTETNVVNFSRTLGVVSPQTVGGTTYQFVSWSDGGAASHSISVPASNTTYTATYQAVSVTSTPTPTPTLSPTPTVTPTPTPVSGEQTVTFDDKSGQNVALNGQYPTNVINWGTSKWFLSAPWGQFTTKSISFYASSAKSATFSFISAKKLTSIEAYNGGSGASTVTFACTGNTTKSLSVAAGTKVTITTGWTTACTTVTVTSSNGWDTNFDNLKYQ